VRHPDLPVPLTSGSRLYHIDPRLRIACADSR
jgi:hypothetical protein